MAEIALSTLTKAIIGVSIGVIVLWFLFFGPGQAFANSLFNLPSFGDPNFTRNTKAIVGIKLENFESQGSFIDNSPLTYYKRNNPQLLYYSGAQWKPVVSEDGTFIIGAKKINQQEVYNALVDFYFGTQRLGDSCFIIRENNRIACVYLSSYSSAHGPLEYLGYVSLNGYSRADYVNGLSLDTFYLSLSNQYLDSQLDPFSGSAVYDPAKKAIIEWRDQIVKGNRAEKHLSLSYMESGKTITNNYAVELVDGYLFVRLDSPAKGSDRYSGLRANPPEPLKLDPSYLTFWISVYPEDEERVEYLISWGQTSSDSPYGWHIRTVRSAGDKISLADSARVPYDRFLLTSSQQRSFEEGLRVLVPKTASFSSLLGSYTYISINQAYVTDPRGFESNLLGEISPYYTYGLEDPDSVTELIMKRYYETF